MSNPLQKLPCQLLFTPDERQHVLETLTGILHEDTRVAGAILAGSGAYGFRDEHSDIDLCVPVLITDDVLPAFKSFGECLAKEFPMLVREESPRGEHSYLHVVILENYLECDIGFLALKDLRATRQHWQVIFDRGWQLDAQMQASWTPPATQPADERAFAMAHDIWYYAMHSAISAKRQDLWRAMAMLDEVRRRIVELRGIRDGYATKLARDVDAMPAAFLNRLAETLPTALTSVEIVRALRIAVALFFAEIDRFAGRDGNSYSKMSKERIGLFLDVIERERSA